MSFVKRKLVKMGNSYYVALPKIFVTEEMAKNGVYIEVLDYSTGDLVLKLRVAHDDGEHDKNNKAGRENTQEPRDTNSIL